MRRPAVFDELDGIDDAHDGVFIGECGEPMQDVGTDCGVDNGFKLA